MNCAYRHIAVVIQFTERSEKSWRSQFMTVTPSIHFNVKALWSTPGLLFELIVPQSDIYCVSVCMSREMLFKAFCTGNYGQVRQTQKTSTMLAQSSRTRFYEKRTEEKAPDPQGLAFVREAGATASRVAFRQNACFRAWGVV